MKKLIFKEENPVIYPKDLHSLHCIGLENPSGTRSFLLNGLPLNHVSAGLQIISNKGLRQELEEVFRDMPYNIYVFDSAYELMVWVYRIEEECL